jgi:release factor glutamine methyltransferase
VEDRIKFVQHNILNDDLPPEIQADVIVSNPPYISKDELNKLDPEIKLYEPRIALTDEKDGMVFYDKIFSLIENGLKFKFLLLELSGSQHEQIIEKANKINIKNIDIYNDFNDIPRILKLEIKG